MHACVSSSGDDGTVAALYPAAAAVGVGVSVPRDVELTRGLSIGRTINCNASEGDDDYNTIAMPSHTCHHIQVTRNFRRRKSGLVAPSWLCRDVEVSDSSVPDSVLQKHARLTATVRRAHACNRSKT